MKELTACNNLVNVLYSYAFQLREDIKEIENTIFDLRNVLMEFSVDKIPDDLHFMIIIKNIKHTLEKMNQIFICNELKFNQWLEDDQINLYELDFLLKQQKEQLDKEFLKHSYLIECFENDHLDALNFWRTNFGELNFVGIDQFFDAYQKLKGKLDEKVLQVMKYYIDFSKDSLVCIWKFYKFLNYFGSFDSFVENIACLIEKGVYVFSISSIKANPKLKHTKRGTYIIRFSKSHSNCFAISFRNDKHDIKQFLVFCSKEGLKLKQSEKIYPNLCEFIKAHRNALRASISIEKMGMFKDKRIDDEDKENSEKQKKCKHCQGLLNDSV